MNIRKLIFAAGMTAMTLPAFAQVSVGVGIDIGGPDYYGRIEIGDYPRPRVIYAEPIVVERVHVVHEPMYLRVPPGHAKNWRKHCGRYGACSRPVYFVEDDWYVREYAPRYRERHGRRDHDHDDHHDHGKGHGKHKHKD